MTTKPKYRLQVLSMALGVLLGLLASFAVALGKTDKVILGSGLGPPYVWDMTAIESGVMKKSACCKY